MNKKPRPSVFILLGLLLSLTLVGAACSAQETGLQVGDPAPTFSAPTAAGDTISLSDYAGQPVLLYFHMAMG